MLDSIVNMNGALLQLILGGIGAVILTAFAFRK
jgi:hypothetical protein